MTVTTTPPTPASRQLINLTYAAWQGCETECEHLRRRLAAAEALIGQLGDHNAELVEVLKACADDLEAEVESFYKETKEYPSEQRRYDRDIAPVLKARAVIAKTPAEPEARFDNVEDMITWLNKP